MNKTWVISVALSLSALHGFADGNYNAQWQKGNALYQQKEYDSAAWYYEQIAAARPQSADIYYNLGNTYYRLNKIGPSILNYERALKIDPGHKDAKENLLLAQSRIPNSIRPVGEIFFIRWWNAVTKPANATPLAISAALLFLAYIGLLVARRLGKFSAPGQLHAAVIFIFSCLFILACFSARSSVDRSRAVVMEAESPLMNRDLKGKPLALLPEGTVVKIVSERTDWLEVKLPDGRQGWVRQDVITRI